MSVYDNYPQCLVGRKARIILNHNFAVSGVVESVGNEAECLQLKKYLMECGMELEPSSGVSRTERASEMLGRRQLQPNPNWLVRTEEGNEVVVVPSAIQAVWVMSEERPRRPEETGPHSTFDIHGAAV